MSEKPETAKELNTIMPELKEIKISNVVVSVSRIRVKQMFSLIRLLKKVADITEGNAPNLAELLKSGEALISQMIFSLETAEKEVYQFFNTLIIPPQDQKEVISQYVLEGDLTLDELGLLVTTLYDQEKDGIGELIKKVLSLTKGLENKKK